MHVTWDSFSLSLVIAQSAVHSLCLENMSLMSKNISDISLIINNQYFIIQSILYLGYVSK